MMAYHAVMNTHMNSGNYNVNNEQRPHGYVREYKVMHTLSHTHTAHKRTHTHMLTYTVTHSLRHMYTRSHTHTHMIHHSHVHTHTFTSTPSYMGNPGRPLQAFGASRARRLMKASVTNTAICRDKDNDNQYYVTYMMYLSVSFID